MKLFNSYDLAGLDLANRVVMAPMTRSRAANGVADVLTERYYTQRASAGLIITEGIAVSRQGTGYLFTPGLYTDDQGQAWRRVTDAGGFDRDSAEAALQEGKADLIGFGQPFVANPDLVERMGHGWPLAQARRETLYGLHGATGYTDYPRHAAQEGAAI